MDTNVESGGAPDAWRADLARRASESQITRVVDVDGFILAMWDTYRADRYGKSILGHAFYAPGATEPLFSGEDFSAGAGTAIDSDEAVRSLLGFLTLRPGDTDPDYFAGYTDAQRAFCDVHAEALSIWAMEPERGEDPVPFNDVSY